MSAALEIINKAIMPTHLASKEIKEQISADIRRRSLFSARTTSAAYIDNMKQILADAVDGKISDGEVRMRLLKSLHELGYTPETGFPGDEQYGTPPASGLSDLSSPRRLNLIAKTNRGMSASVARIKSETAVTMQMFPAWKLIRFHDRSEPRADWAQRWHDAGESVEWEGASQSGFVALKNSPIWQAIGDGEGGYEDTLGNPYPPFAYNSGMAWIDVSRDEAIHKGLDVEEALKDIPDGSFTPSQKAIADTLQRFGKDFTDRLLKELEEMTA